MRVKTRTSVKYKGEWYPAHTVLEISKQDFNSKAFEEVQEIKVPDAANANDTGKEDKDEESSNEEPSNEDNIEIDEYINNLKRQELLNELKKRNIDFKVTEKSEILQQRLKDNW